MAAIRTNGGLFLGSVWVASLALGAGMGTLLGGCAKSSSGGTAQGGIAWADPAKPDLAELEGMMVGRFSSTAQAAADKEFRDISLHMARIWPDKSSAAVKWLYVEQAVSTMLDKPYRQRVYKLTVAADGKSIRSDVYTLPAPPTQWVGGGRNPEMFDRLSEKDLTLREGCSITLERKVLEGQVAYIGKTSGTGCGSDLQGASYATSEANITSAGLKTWDRGFDAQGNQVWGATKGGYMFDRVGGPAKP